MVNSMPRKQNLFVGTSLLALIIACGVGQNVVEEAADEQAMAIWVLLLDAFGSGATVTTVVPSGKTAGASDVTTGSTSQMSRAVGKSSATRAPR